MPGTGRARPAAAAAALWWKRVYSSIRVKEGLIDGGNMGEMIVVGRGEDHWPEAARTAVACRWRRKSRDAARGEIGGKREKERVEEEGVAGATTTGDSSGVATAWRRKKDQGCLQQVPSLPAFPHRRRQEQSNPSRSLTSPVCPFPLHTFSSLDHPLPLATAATAVLSSFRVPSPPIFSSPSLATTLPPAGALPSGLPLSSPLGAVDPLSLPHFPGFSLSSALLFLS